MDVIVYAYERIKNKNPELADTYENYFRLWLKNKANNYNHDKMMRLDFEFFYR